ncbi:sigma-54-dependent Fis family transcriptional regulator [Propionivibrio dicarboxylicus]|uniref:PAS domain S-box-containing protein n=1 Tax=Propionivibrio dicarboxylicus TaxID=83767 RepID=A0A1G7Z9C9_9RHOO|nr:sigma-54-dependent Fis family transcriptional regulator [Propionivibrio dicarboxylicus]SDH04720.1 PAS domain S-box-containing protein [Propionivibrio dicarboxylicus]
MAKIALITSDSDLFEQAGLICRELGLEQELDLYFTTLSDAPRQALQLQQAGVDVIVARGGLAMLIQAALTRTPVVEVVITGQDLARICLEAKAITGLEHPRAAFIAFDNMVTEVDVIAQLANVDVTIHRLQSDEDIPPMVDEVATLNYDVIFGGTRTVKIAKERGLKAVLLLSGALSVRNALLEAKKIALGRQIEKESAEKFKALIDYSLEAIVSIDNEKRILLINPAAAQLFSGFCDDYVGTPVGNIIDLPAIDDCLATGRTVQGEVHKLGTTWISLNIAPITVDRGVIGAFLTFQEVSRIQEAEASIRTEMLVKKFAAKYRTQDIVGKSPQLMEAKRIAGAIATTEASILIQGESGTGKELFAQSIHNQSSRRNGPFVAINCAALPPNLLESELFGYVEGAFTGATKKGKPGLFEMAHQGTLFLDEISEMDKYGQSRLLRVLQERQIMRLGGDKYIPIDVRVIAASNQNLMGLVESGVFRQDLYYRLKVLVLNLPRLSQRSGDIEHLAREFLSRYQKTYQRTIEFSDDAYDELARHNWPGNVRELMHFVERLVVTANTASITGQTVTRFLGNREYDQAGQAVSAAIVLNQVPEQTRVLSALQAHHYNIKETARALGVSRPTLYRWMRKYNIVITKAL